MSDPTTPFPEEDAFLIEDIATLKAMADPLRLRMLLATAERSHTVKEMAAMLGVPATRLYYHVKILERHELMHVASRRMVSGIEERSYQANAKSWNVSPGLMSALAGTGVVKSMFDVAAAELEVALADDALPMGDPASSVPALTFTELYLTVEQVEEVRRWLEHAMVDYGSVGKGEGRTEYHALFAVYKKSRA